MLEELISKNRSYRRFYENVPVDYKTLESLVDLARLSASAKNVQPLRYMLSCTPERNDIISPLLGWAGYLKDWPGPAEGERPSAYIIILGDKELDSEYIKADYGIAAQSILLGATAQGLGGCMLAAIKRKKLREAFEIPSQYEILLVIAIGKPKETVVIDNVGEDGDIRYWRDEKNVHHVPKRSLEALILDL